MLLNNWVVHVVITCTDLFNDSVPRIISLGHYVFKVHVMNSGDSYCLHAVIFKFECTFGIQFVEIW